MLNGLVKYKVIAVVLPDKCMVMSSTGAPGVKAAT